MEAAPAAAAAVARVRAVVADVARLVERAGRAPGSVRVVAVTKGHGPDACRAALEAGVADLGESYAQELVAKAAALALEPGAAPPVWHCIGAVQRNKVAALAPHVAVWHTVDRAPLVEAIAERAPGATVLVQVNLAGDPGRPGCSFEGAPAVVAAARAAGLDVRGLMGVAGHGGPEAARPPFRRLAGLAAELGLDELSMGMSGDLEVAVEEGATLVRLGTALFGER